METIVHQTFCDIGCVNSIGRFEVLQVNAALVGNTAGSTGVQGVVIRTQAD